MKKYFSVFFILALFLGCFFSIPKIYAAMTSGDGYQIWADAISMGGDFSDSPSNYSLDDIIGEMIVGRSSGTMELQPGYQEMEVGVISLNINPTSVNLGDLYSTTTKYADVQMEFFSNLAQGKVYFTGTSLNNGSDTITPVGSMAQSAIEGARQFGFNVSYESGDTNSEPLAPYNVSNKYAFNSGDEIVRAEYAMGSSTTFNLKFMANINGSETTGNYNSNLVFTALGGF